MSSRFALVVLCLASVSCAELGPGSDDGEGGSGGLDGSGGTAGIDGGGGAGGTAGSGGIDPCAVIPEAADTPPESDYTVNAEGLVSAFLCAGDGCVPEEDLSDSWAVAITCGGTYEIVLEWDNNLDDDLDLVLFDSIGEVDRAETRTALGTNPVQLTEEITASLSIGEPYVIQVVAINTSDNRRNYRLQLSLVE